MIGHKSKTQRHSSKFFPFSHVFVWENSIRVLRHGGMTETVENEDTEEVPRLVLFLYEYFLFFISSLLMPFVKWAIFS
jgi:hypothetical protein